MTTLYVRLPDSLSRFLEAEVAAKKALLTRMHKRRQFWDKIEPLVLEGLASPASEMTEDDWRELRASISQVGKKRKRKKS
jgi:hypothetical protein